MTSYVENLIKNIDIQIAEIIAFINDHCEVYDYSKPYSGIVILGATGSFREISTEAKIIQNEIRKKTWKMIDILSILFRNVADEYKNCFDNFEEYLKKVIDQNRSIWEDNNTKCIESIHNKSKKIKDDLFVLYPVNKKISVFIPDTNQLISYPDIEKWILDESMALIVLLPTVISELDNHKINHRNEEVRIKSIGIINRIKEYRRRGKLTDGICILKDKIDLVCIAEEPDFKLAFSWMDKDNNDDRFIVSALNILTKYANTNICILTGDLNMQNKLELIDFPYREL